MKSDNILVPVDFSESSTNANAVKSTTVKTNDRTRLLELLNELSERFPDMRLGQLICNLSMAARGAEESATWDCEDEELIAAARQWLSRQSVPTDESAIANHAT